MATGRRDVDDYSFSRPAMAALARGLMRYLYANGKGLTAAEVAVIAAAAKMLGLNYEAGAGDFIGAANGRAHAVAAAQLAARLPVRKAPIIFSADWAVQVTQFRAVGDALEAAAAVLGWGWVGLYGHAGLMDYIAARFGAAAFRWQTYAWSGGRLSPSADLYQFSNGQNVTGGQVDFNQITGRNFLTALSGTTPQSDETTPLSEEDIDMTPDELRYIVRELLSEGPGARVMPSGQPFAPLAGSIVETLTETRALAGVAAGYPGRNDTEQGPAVLLATVKALASGSAQLDPAAVAAALAPLLVPHLQPGADAAAVAAAVIDALAARISS